MSKKVVIIFVILCIWMVGCGKKENVEPVEEIKKMDFKKFKVEEIQGKVTASSTLNNQGNIKYGAKLVLDKDKDTAWVEGVEGNGVGEYIEIDFEEKVLIKDIKIRNGYTKNKDIYYKNSRVKKIKIDYDGEKSTQFILSDGYESLQTKASYWDIITTKIKITILEVFEGEKYEDTAISDIVMYGIKNIGDLSDEELKDLKKEPYEKVKIDSIKYEKEKESVEVVDMMKTYEELTRDLNSYLGKNVEIIGEVSDVQSNGDKSIVVVNMYNSRDNYNNGSIIIKTEKYFKYSIGDTVRVLGNIEGNFREEGNELANWFGRGFEIYLPDRVSERRIPIIRSWSIWQ